MSTLTSWETNNEIPIMNLFLIMTLKKPVFNVKLKLLMINFNVSQFLEHISRSSCSQIFFKTGALKNFAILRNKNVTPTQVFSCKKQPRDVINILIDFLLKMLG